MRCLDCGIRYTIEGGMRRKGLCNNCMVVIQRSTGALGSMLGAGVCAVCLRDALPEELTGGPDPVCKQCLDLVRRGT